jgi:hypothetical protein
MAQFTTTYSGLISLLEDYTEDDSTEFVAAQQGVVNRAEERVLRDLDLSIFNTIVSTSMTSGVRTSAKGFTQSPVHNVLLTASNTFPERRSLPYIQAHGGSGEPLYYYDNEDTIYWAPTPDASYAIDLTYYKRPDPLTPSNQTNWLTRNVADLLLLVSLIESERFLISPERVAEFEQTYSMNLGPARATWRDNMQTHYEPVSPAPTPERTR